MTNYQNKFKNKNKLAYIVGGSGRIGNEIIIAMVSSGAKIVILDIKKNVLKKNCYFQYFDCSDSQNLWKNFSRVLSKFGSPNIFINCS